MACEDENGKVKFISHHTNALTKNCEICVYNKELSAGPCCEMYPKLAGFSSDRVVLCSHVYNCDAYTPIEPLNVIFSENDMIRFIEKPKISFTVQKIMNIIMGLKETGMKRQAIS